MFYIIREVDGETKFLLTIRNGFTVWTREPDIRGAYSEESQAIRMAERLEDDEDDIGVVEMEGAVMLPVSR